MRCSGCGRDNEKPGKFCVFCGTELPKSEEVRAAFLCPRCHNPLQLNHAFCDKCGYRVPKKTAHVSSAWKWILLGCVALLGLILATQFMEESAPNQYVEVGRPSLPPEPEPEPKEGLSQEEIIAAVVNIRCPSTEEEGAVYTGSGTLISEDGLILTNSHVIPQDEEFVFVDEDGCVVTIPDPVTGQVAEIYFAQPDVKIGLSDDYDIAFLQINDVYTDDEGTTWGEYPKRFSSIYDRFCENPEPRLGEPIRVYGYPGIGGGYSLTVTEGIVSGFPEYGMIATSAKIDQGNSGGLAVDAQGCMVGIPTAVVVGDYESLGRIISTKLISEFADQLSE